MKIKTINRNLYTKMRSWLATITAEKLRERVRNNIIVTGGSIPSMFLNEPINDYDIYIDDADVCVDLIKYYMKKHLKSKDRIIKREGEGGGVEIFISSDGILKLKPVGKKEYQLIYVTSNAITLSDNVQIVTRFTGNPEEIHKNYDFIHATNYWTFKTGLVTNIRALESLLTKELRYQGSKFPLCSIIRTRKFVRRKWTINAGQYLKMALQLNELDLLDVKVLEEQLIGVDIAYFSHLIGILKAHQDENADKMLDTSWLIEAIDRVFDAEIITETDGEDGDGELQF